MKLIGNILLSRQVSRVVVLMSMLSLPSLDTNAQKQALVPQDLFDSNRVVEVQIALPSGDWDTLRNQERDITSLLSKDRLEHTVPSPYTWFHASVKVDGVSLTNVGIRKRGFVGSADKERPGLNIEFNKFVKGQTVAGQSSLKLHNNKQDGSNSRQLLAYQLFTAAGVPAPRCNLAHVTVNGTNLGVYSHVEAIDGKFLKRKFGNSQGNLYEAQISDFRPGWTRTFEKKNNEKETERRDLDAVVTALESDDAHLLERLGKVLDIDAFITFWAVESLINHWDGFAGDLNNSYLYRDPDDGKLRFIPWGTDSTFGTHNIFVPFEPPASVWAVSVLPRRLYNHPVTQAKYRERMQELLANTWNETQLLAEVERLGKLVQGMSTVSPFRAGPETEQLRQFIRGRKEEIKSELKTPAEPWNHPSRREMFSTTVGKISVEFISEWVASAFSPAPSGARANVTFDFYGRHYTGNFSDVKATSDFLNPMNASLLLSGSFKGVEVPVSIWLSVSTNQFTTGKSFTGAGPGSGILVVAGQIGKKDWRILGGGPFGTTQLNEAGMTPGAKVRGRIETEISTVPWEDFNLANLKKAP